MIRVLIVDDKAEKQTEIYNLIKGVLGTEGIDYELATFALDAKKILESKSVDIMILDICLPLRYEDRATPDGGIRLLKELKGIRRKYSYPGYVIGLSEYRDLVEKFSLQEGLIHTSIHYDPNSNEWSVRLSECVKSVAAILRNNIVRRDYDFDIAVVCALQEELEYVRKYLENERRCGINEEEMIFYEGELTKEGRKLRVVAARTADKGMIAAAVLTTKMIHDFAPRYVVMTGIAAGIRGKVQLGDVVVARYAWDYGAGKEAVQDRQTVHKNSIDQIPIGTRMEAWALEMSENKQLLAQIEAKYMGKKPGTVLQMYVGPVATGAAVIANRDKVKEIQEQIRDVIAIEMEIYGVYYAAKWAIGPKPQFVAVKSVCDFADEKKADDFHDYADYVSASVFYHLATQYFEY